MTPTQAQLDEGKRAALEAAKTAAEEAKEAEKTEALITSAETLSINPQHSKSTGSPKKRKVEEESLGEPAASPKKKKKVVDDLLESWEDEEDESAASGISSGDEDPPATPQQRKHTSSSSTPRSSASSTPLAHEVHENHLGYIENSAQDSAAQGAKTDRGRPRTNVSASRGKELIRGGEFKHILKMSPGQRQQLAATKLEEEAKRRKEEAEKEKEKAELERQKKLKDAPWEDEAWTG